MRNRIYNGYGEHITIISFSLRCLMCAFDCFKICCCMACMNGSHVSILLRYSDHLGSSQCPRHFFNWYIVVHILTVEFCIAFWLHLNCSWNFCHCYCINYTELWSCTAPFPSASAVLRHYRNCLIIVIIIIIIIVIVVIIPRVLILQDLTIIMDAWNGFSLGKLWFYCLLVLLFVIIQI